MATLVAGLITLAITTGWASAATIVVDTLSDRADAPFNQDGVCGSGSISDLPGADGHVSLREAIIAANNSPGPNNITFADSLRGGTIHINFDSLDADNTPDALPILCGGATTIDGDIDKDGVGDVTLDGSALTGQSSGLVLASSNNQILNLRIQDAPFAGVGVVHVASQSSLVTVIGNRIAGDTIAGSVYGIFVIAGSASPAGVGSIDATEIVGNVVDSTTQYDAIFVSTAPVAGSIISNTTIAENHLSGARRHGVYVLASYAAGGETTTIRDTMIQDNNVFDNAVQGVSVSSYAGPSHTINGLTISNNQIYGNGSAGVSLAAGVCGATESVLGATLSGNTINDNGQQDRGPGMILIGGSNYACPLPLSGTANTNRLTVIVDENTFSGNFGGQVAIVGGYVGADDNSVAATLTQNTIGSGLFGIGVAGGMGTVNDETSPADGNSVRAAISGNAVEMALGGILLAGGSSGPANNNRLDLVVESNSSCSSTVADLTCVGGFTGLVGFPANTGTGNVVDGLIRDNEATSIVAADGVSGNTCSAELTDNRACGAPTPTPTPLPTCIGDCDGNGQVTIDEIIVMVNIALDLQPLSNCSAGDGDHDGAIAINEIIAAANRAASGC